jgi:hypothetical protein
MNLLITWLGDRGRGFFLRLVDWRISSGTVANRISCSVVLSLCLLESGVKGMNSRS